MSSETASNDLESNIQYTIEDIPSLNEETTLNNDTSVQEFTLNHVEEMVQPEPISFFSSVVSEEQPLVMPEVVLQEEQPIVMPEVVLQEEQPLVMPEVVLPEEQPLVMPEVVLQEEQPLVMPEVVLPEEPVVVVSPEEPVIECNTPPKLVFIVPYRDRQQQYLFFSQHMKVILEDIPTSEYEIFYIHQCDSRDFNRGAMKNIGFLYVKEKYPNDYKDITLVFNDIDTMPYVKNFLNYNTVTGKVKHFYGFQFTLGGIVSIKAGDFEKVNGFPNFWAWGYEDNLLQKRVLDNGLSIDRSQFYPLMDKNILQMKDGLNRIVNRTEFDRYMSETREGIQSIKNLTYTIDSSTGFVNVSLFNTDNDPVSKLNSIHDLRNGNKPFNINPVMSNGVRKGRGRMGMSLF
jgi:hypothetical protein